MEKDVKSNAGVSIIEILIAMVIIAIALVAVVTVFPRMSSHGKAIHESDHGRMIAMEVLEGLQLLSEDPANSCVAGGSPAQNTFAATFANRTVGAVTYNPTARPMTVAWNCSAGGINTVTVTVNWTKTGNNHRVSVTGAVR